MSAPHDAERKQRRLPGLFLGLKHLLCHVLMPANSMITAPRAKTAFVLAGGGSLGAVQVGMLRELVAHDVRADIVVGSSVGAVNGAYFAADPSAAGVARLEKIWTELQQDDVFPLTPASLLRLFSRRDNLVNPANLRRLIEKHLPYRILQEAALPVHTVATEYVSGAAITFSSGPAVEAILASSAIPGVFPPVAIGGRSYIDGAVASNTPITSAVALGATRLIVLPTGHACAIESPIRGVLANVVHAFNLLIVHQLLEEIEDLSKAVDMVTVPPLCPLQVSGLDFSRAAELIERAAASTRNWIEQGGLEQRAVPSSLSPHRH